MMQGGAQHTGQSDETGPLTPAVSWVFTSPPGVAMVGAPVAVVKGIAYLNYSDFGIVHIDAISTSTHKLLWDWSSPGSLAPSGLAVGPDGTVYLTDGSVVAISPGGQMKWTFTTDAQEFGPPTVGPDGTVYVDSLGPSLFALDPGDGHVLWSYDAPPSPVDSPIAATPALSPDGKTLYDSEGTYVLAVSAGRDGGSLRWSDKAAPNGTAFYTAPAVGPDGTVYVDTSGNVECDSACYSTFTGDVEALRPDGSVKWLYHGSALFLASPALSDTGLVIQTDQHGMVTALSQATGDVIWKTRVGSPSTGLPSNSPDAAIGATGNVYVSYGSVLTAISPAGITLWTIPDLPQGLLTGGALSIGPDGNLYTAAVAPTKPAISLVSLGWPTVG